MRNFKFALALCVLMFGGSWRCPVSEGRYRLRSGGNDAAVVVGQMGFEGLATSVLWEAIGCDGACQVWIG